MRKKERRKIKVARNFICFIYVTYFVKNEKLKKKRKKEKRKEREEKNQEKLKNTKFNFILSFFIHRFVL